MKLLYIAPVYINEEKPDGVGKKIYNHIGEFKKYFDTTLLYYGKPVKGDRRKMELYCTKK